MHPTADTEIRVRQAKEIVDNAGADDMTYVEMKGAPHYLEGHRPEALPIVADWLGQALPLAAYAPPANQPSKRPPRVQTLNVRSARRGFEACVP